LVVVIPKGSLMGEQKVNVNRVFLRGRCNFIVSLAQIASLKSRSNPKSPNPILPHTLLLIPHFPLPRGLIIKVRFRVYISWSATFFMYYSYLNCSLYSSVPCKELLNEKGKRRNDKSENVWKFWKKNIRWLLWLCCM